MSTRPLPWFVCSVWPFGPLCEALKRAALLERDNGRGRGRAAAFTAALNNSFGRGPGTTLIWVLDVNEGRSTADSFTHGRSMFKDKKNNTLFFLRIHVLGG